MKYLPVILVALLVSACSSSTSKFEEVPEGGSATEVEVQEEVVVEKPAVCVWDNISVREEPSSKAKWVTSVSVGETLTYLGKSAIDSADKDRKYLSIKLADGTEGWSLADFIIVDSEVAVFTEDASIYKRPDLLTKTENVFSKFGIVAISNVEGDWSEVVGKRTDGKWITTGWVKGANLSKQAIDVAVAKFTSSALSKDSEEEQKEALNGILENSDLVTSQFIDDISKMLDDMTEEIVPEEIEEAADSISDAM